MQAQGSLIDQQWIDAKVAELNAIDSCADLQRIINVAMATLLSEVAAIRAQIAALLPLLSFPTSLSSVISWIGNFATGLVAPYAKYVAQLSATLAAVTTLTNAMTAAAGRILNCSVTIPPVV